MRHFQDAVQSNGQSTSHPFTSVGHENGAVSDSRDIQDTSNQPSVHSLNVPVSSHNGPKF